MNKQFDIIIVGAGAAGIAAGRKLADSGLSFIILEARDRIGGRAVTDMIDMHPIDLGAHWIHAGAINPIVPIARADGFKLARARYEFTAWRNGAPLGRLARWALDNAWEKSENRIFEVAEAIEDGRPDTSVKAAIGNVGPWTAAASFMHGNYDCGADPSLLSTQDFARVDDGMDLLVDGGFGGLIAGLAKDLPVMMGVEVTELHQTPNGAELRCANGVVFTARAVIMTVPLMVLKGAGIRFVPELPSRMSHAFNQFHPAAYEHVIIRSSDPPWGKVANRIVLSMLDDEHIVLFANMDETDLHYLDMVGDAGRALSTLQEAERKAQAMAALIRHFGADTAQRAEVIRVTQWASDPLSRGAWALANVGAAHARAALRESAGCLFLAGEACSQGQWGTVGGAWSEGERAADQALELVVSGRAAQLMV